MKTSKIIFFCALMFLSAILLSGCNFIPLVTGTLPADTATPESNLPPVIGPEAARQTALVYIQGRYGFAIPLGAIWSAETLSPAGTVGSSTYKYIADGWEVIVSYPIVAPQATIYTVKASAAALGFAWEGLVDAYGQVAETAVITGGTGTVPTASVPTASVPTATVPTATAPAPTEPAAPTSTRTSPLPTNTPAPTATPLPTNTPLPTLTPTPKPLPCNAAKFIDDVTVPDGTAFAPNTDFTKTWRLQNSGTCTWTTEYDLIYVDGSQMDGKKAVDMPRNVKPGETVDLSVVLTSPAKSGDYRGYWMLRAADGTVFGVGTDFDKAFWVVIYVIKTSGNYAYDFALDYCAATWRSDIQRLPCPGDKNDENGFVRLLENPRLENRPENEPALWVHSNEERYGWIEGSFPAFKVKSGDHFKAWVGCLEGYDRCDVTFYLAYETESGKVRTLATWIETYDGDITQIDLDLSGLAGETVRFILGMEANTRNADDAQGFWFVPRIERPSSSVQSEDLRP